MLSIEKKIFDYINKNRYVIFVGVVTLLSVMARFYLLYYRSDDMIVCLEPWFEGLKNHGGLGGLKYYQSELNGNYNYPYATLMALLTYLPSAIKPIYLVKALSIVFDYLLAGLCAYFTYDLTKNYFKSVLVYSIVVLLPSVVLNSSMWGQCDAIYSFFVVLALYFLLKKKYLYTFIFTGVAVAFKAQAILVLLPLLLIAYCNRRDFSLLYFLIIPLVDIVMCLPALLSGVSVNEIINVYINQAGTYSHMVYNYPNIYYLLSPASDGLGMGSSGLYYMIAGCGLTLLYLLERNKKMDDKKMLELSVWLIVMVCFLMPGIHERYCYTAEVMAVVYCVVYGENIFVPVFLNFVSLICYSNYLLHTESAGMNILAVMYFVFFCFYTKKTLISERGNK
ncbi:MAG: hypothetical protein Q4D13_07735 [Erysipelotrichaceae bacterium]|nr:hypothetical protein [Erysipelotrichaceae bacterium]